MIAINGPGAGNSSLAKHPVDRDRTRPNVQIYADRFKRVRSRPMAAQPPLPRIVGSSVLSPLGVGRQEFIDGLLSGRVGQPSPEAHPAGPPSVGYALDGFDPTQMLGAKSTRTLDRMTLMVIATTDMLLREHEHTFGDR